MRQRLPILVAFAILATAEAALAGTPGQPGPVVADAKELFNDGIRLYQEQRVAEALDAFRRANELQPTWRLLYNIGQCEATLKHYAEALDAFEEYLVAGGDEIPLARQQEVAGEIKRLHTLVGVLEIQGRAGDDVVVSAADRTPISGQLPDLARMRLTIGKVEVQVRRGGRLLLDEPANIVGRETVTLVVPGNGPEAAPSAATAAPANDATNDGSADDRDRLWTWVALGVGGAAIVAGTVTGVLAYRARATVEDGCVDGVCPTSLENDEDRAFNLAVTTDALIGVGVIGLGAAALLYVFEPEWLADQDIQVTPTATATGTGITVSGRFSP